MNHRTRCASAVLLAAALLLAGCSKPADVTLPETATMEPIKGTGLNRIVLEDAAYQSLGIKTEPVREEIVPAAAAATATAGPGAVFTRRLVIPVSALIFDPNGAPYAYTSPSPKTYVRAPLVIDRFRGTDVVLIKGPPAGTQVVTVGDPELLGIEYGVGAE